MTPSRAYDLARFALRHPLMSYYRAYIRARGVKLDGDIWICARPNVTLGGDSSCSIGEGAFIPTPIQIRGADRGRIIIGKYSSLDTLARLHVANDATLRLGEHVSIGPFNIINAFDDCTIEDNAMLGPFVNVNCADHGMEICDVAMRFQEGTYAPVFIGEECWIGSHSVILKGSRIGRGAVVAAGSVVCGDVPEMTIVGGVPARVIKKR
ncbi:MAG: acyltransferase [Candidatus Geothermincolia bacterium]